MNLEKQVVSLDLAKRLKELGVAQRSYFHWKLNTRSPDGDIHDWVLVDYGLPSDFDGSTYHVAAFTVAELGEMLPTGYEPRRYASTFPKWERELPKGAWISEIKEADARAKMVIYLLEKNLITN